jgi:opacity protein-like surface antigen
VTEHGVYVEPRFSVAPFRNFTPYLSGRLGFIRRSAPAGAQYSAESASLVGYGAGVGTLVWVAPGVQLDVSAMYSRLSGDAGAGAPGAPRPFAGGTGGAAMLRAGLVLGFDRWGR